MAKKYSLIKNDNTIEHFDTEEDLELAKRLDKPKTFDSMYEDEEDDFGGSILSGLLGLIIGALFAIFVIENYDMEGLSKILKMLFIVFCSLSLCYVMARLSSLLWGIVAIAFVLGLLFIFYYSFWVLL